MNTLRMGLPRATAPRESTAFGRRAGTGQRTSKIRTQEERWIKTVLLLQREDLPLCTQTLLKVF